MYCRQCEQAAKGISCTVSGVCGKTPDVSALQDLLIHALKGIAVYGQLAYSLGVRNKETEDFLRKGLFTTVTNVSFDPESLARMIQESAKIKNGIKSEFLNSYRQKTGKEFREELPAAAGWAPAADLNGLLQQAELAGLKADPTINEDVQSLREILLYGLKGMAAYADHAAILGKEDQEVSAFFYKGLTALDDAKLTINELISLIMEFGKANLRCMQILDEAHTERFGHPEPTGVSLGVKQGPAIIVSGHDLLDLQQLLEQTAGKGVNVYTHGEMLPAHGYPGLKKYTQLAGHFGTAWQNQQKEFAGVPAAVLLTTNCIQKPQKSYQDRIFTAGLVAWPGITHINEVGGKKDFSAVIKKALALGGFPEEAKEKEITVGFAHKTVTSVVDTVLDLVGKKKIRHFFLVGGCDGARPGRNYFTELAEKIPQDCLLLTLACGKFRFNRLEFGDIEGIPRLLDCGQCNDAYSAIKIATGLAEKLNCGVNDLPLSLVLSWYEQKAVCILLTLFSLGVKNIRLGPSLPAFVSPNVLKVLVETFAVKPITAVDQDLADILGQSISIPL